MCVVAVNFERPDALRIQGGGILQTPNYLAALASGGEELDVHLDIVGRHLFVVGLGVDYTHALSCDGKPTPLRRRMRVTPASEIVIP